MDDRFAVEGNVPRLPFPRLGVVWWGLVGPPTGRARKDDPHCRMFGGLLRPKLSANSASGFFVRSSTISGTQNATSLTFADETRPWFDDPDVARHPRFSSSPGCTTQIAESPAPRVRVARNVDLMEKKYDASATHVLAWLPKNSPNRVCLPDRSGAVWLPRRTTHRLWTHARIRTLLEFESAIYARLKKATLSPDHSQTSRDDRRHVCRPKSGMMHKTRASCSYLLRIEQPGCGRRSPKPKSL